MYANTISLDSNSLFSSDSFTGAITEVPTIPFLYRLFSPRRPVFVGLPDVACYLADKTQGTRYATRFHCQMFSDFGPNFFPPIFTESCLDNVDFGNQAKFKTSILTESDSTVSTDVQAAQEEIKSLKSQLKNVKRKDTSVPGGLCAFT